MVIDEWSNVIHLYFRCYTLVCFYLSAHYDELVVRCEEQDLYELVKAINALLAKLVISNDLAPASYHIAIDSINLSFEHLKIDFRTNPTIVKVINEIEEGVRISSESWEHTPNIVSSMEIGRSLAKDFYSEGKRGYNLSAIENRNPNLIFGKIKRTETNGSIPRMLSTLNFDLLLTFSRNHSVYSYLSLPIMFFHEFLSHIYVPVIHATLFNEGWLLYATQRYLFSRFPEVTKNYGLSLNTVSLLNNFWYSTFTKPAKLGWKAADFVIMCVSEGKFFNYTWDLASIPYDYDNKYEDIHFDFIKSINELVAKKNYKLLFEASATAENVFELFENINTCKNAENNVG